MTFQGELKPGWNISGFKCQLPSRKDTKKPLEVQSCHPNGLMHDRCFCSSDPQAWFSSQVSSQVQLFVLVCSDLIWRPATCSPKSDWRELCTHSVSCCQPALSCLHSSPVLILCRETSPALPHLVVLFFHFLPTISTSLLPWISSSLLCSFGHNFLCFPSYFSLQTAFRHGTESQICATMFLFTDCLQETSGFME